MGLAVGAFALPTNSAVFTFALSTNALLAIPKKLYAACKPYSFNSLPCNGLPDASVKNFGSPKVSVNSLCDEIKKAVLALAVCVPAAVPSPAPFCLSCADATMNSGVVPASDGT